jgi:protein TonB
VKRSFSKLSKRNYLMKRDIILSAIIAVAVHVSILSAALPRAMDTHGNMREPMALSIVHPRAAAVGPSPKHEAAETGRKPHFVSKSQDMPKRAFISKSKPSQKKRPIVRPTIKKRDLKISQPKEVTRLAPAFAPKDKVESVPERSLGHAPEGVDKTTEGGAAFNTPPIASVTTKEDGNNIGTPGGYGSAEAMITYATPKYKENPLPLYPNMARRRGYEGRTLLRVEVLESGKVGRIEIATSSGFDVLDRAALASVKDWTFLPGTENGNNMKQWVMVPIKFSLR